MSFSVSTEINSIQKYVTKKRAYSTLRFTSKKGDVSILPTLANKTGKSREIGTKKIRIHPKSIYTHEFTSTHVFV